MGVRAALASDLEKGEVTEMENEKGSENRAPGGVESVPTVSATSSRRRFLQAGAVGAGAAASLYIKPTFRSIGIPTALAASGSQGGPCDRDPDRVGCVCAQAGNAPNTPPWLACICAQVPNDPRCTCPPGKVLVNGQCVCDNVPCVGGTVNADCECVCPQGTVLVNGQCLTPGAEGCTPGYWKQSHHFDSYPAPYSASDTLSSRFPGLNFPGINENTTSLDEALDTGGGGTNALLRHFVAAVLNAASGSVNYQYESVASLTTAVGNALAGTPASLNGTTYTSVEALKNALDSANNGNDGCPLN
jgi:hypothetical protein